MGLERDLTHDVEARYSEEETQSWTVSWQEGDERMQEISFEFEVEAEEVAAAPAPTRRRSRTRRSARTPTPAPAPQRSRDDSAVSAGLDPFAVAQEMEQGLLTVRVSAEQARIYVDGNLVQDGNSLRGHALDEGSYDVRVYFPQLKRHSDTRAVMIRSGETSTVTFSP
jgi:hypothetical protein